MNTKVVLYSKYTFIAAMAIVGTWAAMTILHLQEVNSTLEVRIDELKTSKVVLDSVATQLQEEKEVLESHPLN